MNVTLTAGTAGQRADQFLAAALDGLTRSAAQKLLEEGRVLRGGKALKKNDRVQPGDVLTLHCELVQQHGAVGVGKASAWVDGKCAVTAELTFVLTDAAE